MKSILIVVPSFGIGGTVTALINLVTLIDKTKYDVNVFAITNSGPNKVFVANQCKIVGEENNNTLKETAKSVLRRKIFENIKRIKKALEKIGIDLSPLLFRFYARRIDVRHYDIVIAFQEGQATRFCSYFKNGFKIAWVRSEYSRFVKGVNRDYSRVYDKYDRIVTVSQASMSNFLSVLPQYKDISVIQYDFLNDNRIIRLSRETPEGMIKSDVFTMISVGRIDPVKRFKEIPRIARHLLDKGLSFRWFILGGAEGNRSEVIEEFEMLEAAVVRYDAKCVCLLGGHSNPYPYILNSDMLVCLSESETFNYTLTEAKILGIPIVTTDYACAHESVNNGEEGLIVPFSEITEAIESMITNKDGIYQRIRGNLLSYKYDKDIYLDTLYDTVLQ